VPLGRSESRRAVSAFLQGAQTSLSAGLMEHMDEKLLKGEGTAHQSVLPLEMVDKSASPF
jgi:hypothetical protein